MTSKKQLKGCTWQWPQTSWMQHNVKGLRSHLDEARDERLEAAPLLSRAAAALLCAALLTATCCCTAGCCCAGGRRSLTAGNPWRRPCRKEFTYVGLHRCASTCTGVQAPAQGTTAAMSAATLVGRSSGSATHSNTGMARVGAPELTKLHHSPAGGAAGPAAAAAAAQLWREPHVRAGAPGLARRRWVVSPTDQARCPPQTW